ncbi:fibrobacter succinogenes major paralogous domain-containing protein [Flavobacterium sp. N502540]|uniref:fibrobacter succinogenes major paralogous domain-containing protein n=1 Tax=Flavobacterium sp. N502540 TaxID=2986838 RepID=UPI0022243C1B|nr:fibrobacter succinogenes major paralogous domain-containing protein [Flavobacterium sp. N502540]
MGKLFLSFILLLLIPNKTENNIAADIDGNKYTIIKIDKYLISNQNLNVSHFRNGDVIPEVKTIQEWRKYGKLKKPAWCYHESNEKNKKKIGKIYNGFAVNDPRGLCPNGFHIPTHKEWKEIITSLGGYDNAGLHLKSKNWDGDNSSEFNAVPGGYRSTVNEIDFYPLDYCVLFWGTKVQVSKNSNDFIGLMDGDNSVNGEVTAHTSENGMYVRFIKNN